MSLRLIGAPALEMLLTIELTVNSEFIFMFQGFRRVLYKSQDELCHLFFSYERWLFHNLSRFIILVYWYVRTGTLQQKQSTMICFVIHK